MDEPDPNAAWNEMLPVEQFAWYGFLRTYGTLVPVLDTELQQTYRLSLSSYDVLVQLSLSPDHRLTMSELAGGVLLSPSGLTRLIERLEREGMVSRHSGQTDSRQKLATITAHGLEWLADAERFHVAGIRRRFFDRLSSDQVDCLAALWLRLVPALTETARALGLPVPAAPEQEVSTATQE